MRRLGSLAARRARKAALLGRRRRSGVPATVRRRPCASCPYRVNVEPGIWAAEEYEKLPAYDRETPFQPAAVFVCHQQDGCVCAGWAGRPSSGDLLALRLGVLDGAVDASAFEYETDVPLFATGAEAATHGLSGVEVPSERAVQVGRKIVAARAGRAGRARRE